MTSTVPNKNKVDEEVYKLKLTGQIPKLAEPKETEISDEVKETTNNAPSSEI